MAAILALLPAHLTRLVAAVVKRAPLLLLGLAMIGNANATAQVQCVNHVESYSNRAHMAEGDFSANVLFRDIDLGSTSIGFGPAGGRKYELTIDGGQLHMARPLDDGKFEVRHDPQADEGAIMLQLASPALWAEMDSLDAISSLDDLNFVLDEMLEELGCDDTAILPFRIEGRIQHASWSLDTLPEHHVGKANEQDAVIIGIYSQTQKKRLFMVPGYNLHAHIVLKQDGIAGHLRDLELAEGAKLFLPQASRPSN